MKFRLKLWTLRILFATALLLIGYQWGGWGQRSNAVVHAQGATTTVNIPKAWGPIIGTMNGILILQDREGTIRLVAADTGALGEIVTRN
jgi:hypothetical protein